MSKLDEETVSEERREKTEGGIQTGRPPWHRLMNRPGQFVLDLAVLAVAFVVSYLLRFEFVIPRPQLENLAAQLPMVLLLQFGAMQMQAMMGEERLL